MKTKLLVKPLPSDINDVLTRIKLGRTLYGQPGAHAGVLDHHGVLHANRKTT